MSQIETYRILVRPDEAASPLYMILHGENLSPQEEKNLQLLEEELLNNFPQSAIAFSKFMATAEQGDDASDSCEDGIQSEFSIHIRHLQQKFEVSAEATALIGIGEGAGHILELTKLSPNLAGRFISFGGKYQSLPEEELEPKQTVHIFHADQDQDSSVDHAHKAFMSISNLQGDATIDILNNFEQSFSEPLIKKMITRLQTYVPLWMCKEIGKLSPEELDALADAQENKQIH